MIANSHISGTILNGEQSVLRLQGIQFSGEAFILETEMQQQARKIYLQNILLPDLIHRNFGTSELIGLK